MPVTKSVSNFILFILANKMDLNKSLEEAELAVNYFFNNKFNEARELMKLW